LGGHDPRVSLTGGDLIAMGLAPGPLVARTLQQVERAWVADGFAGDREVLKGLARTYVDQVLRDSQ
jgi:poly(A) polymerase